MKSGLAAMVTATERFVARHPRHRGSLAFLLTSDEEGPSVDGTRRVIEVLTARGERIDWCVVGEPTSHEVLGDTIKIGRRGSLSGRLTVHGVQGHIAYPQLADNPVHRLRAGTRRTRRHALGRRQRILPADVASRSRTSSAGTGAPNVIPGELKVRFNLRFSTEQTVESLQRTVTRDPRPPRRQLHARVVRVRTALPDAAGCAHRPPSMRAVREITGRTPRVFDDAAARRTAASSPRPAPRSSNSAS